MRWRIDYSDDKGAGDLDPVEYDTKDQAADEARARLDSGDMPWAITARVFPIEDDGEPAADQAAATTIKA
jgi:hypothetical protein